MSTITAPARTDVPDVGAPAGAVPHLDAVHDHLLWVTLNADRAAAVTTEVGLRAAGRLADGVEGADTLQSLLRAAHRRLPRAGTTTPTEGGLASLHAANPHVAPDVLHRVASAFATLPRDVVATLHLTARTDLDAAALADVLGVDRAHADRLRDRADLRAHEALEAAGLAAVDARALLVGLAPTPAPRAVHVLVAAAGATRRPRRRPLLTWLAAAGVTAVAGIVLAAGVQHVVTAEQDPPTVVAAVPVPTPTTTTDVADDESAVDPLAVEQPSGATVVDRPATTASSDGDAATAGQDTDAPTSGARDDDTVGAAPDEAQPDAPEGTTDDDTSAEDETTESEGSTPEEPSGEPSPEPSGGSPLGELLDPDA